MKIFRLSIVLAVIMLFLSGCSKVFENYKEKKGDPKGSTYENLKKLGGHEYFLAAIDRSGYKKDIDGAALLSVFAPTDEALKDYFQQKFGTTDLNAIPTAEVEFIVGYHMVKYAFNQNDLVAFSAMTDKEGNSMGDGSCYKYETKARDSIKVLTDPLDDRRKVKVYANEKFIPIFSTRIFQKRTIDAKTDYEKIFPDVDWQGDDDRLYVGNAAVMPNGVANNGDIRYAIPTDNGYLYTLSGIAPVMPTIYNALGDDQWPSNTSYKLVKLLFERFNNYTYDKALSEKYAGPLDSIYMFNHYRTPTRFTVASQNANALFVMPPMANVANDWTYDGFDKYEQRLRFAISGFAPEDNALETYLRDFFMEYGNTDEGGNLLPIEQFVKKLPNIAIYHFLQTHFSGFKNIILPTELDRPVRGPLGEEFAIGQGSVKDVRLCSNGIVYGINKCLESSMFTMLPKPLLQYPKFIFFANATTARSIYQEMIDQYNKYTLFVLDKASLDKLGYRVEENPHSALSFSFYLGSNAQTVAQINNLVNRHFFYGIMPDPADNPDEIRFYVARDGLTYIHSYGGYFWTESRHLNATACRSIEMDDVAPGPYTTANGNVYNLNGLIPANQGSPDLANHGKYPINNFANEFRALLISAGLMNASNAWVAVPENCVAFLPSDKAVLEAKEDGRIPTDPAELARYLRYYFLPLQRSRLSTYMLPGLGPNGVTDEKYTADMISWVTYYEDKDAQHAWVSWDPAMPNRMTLTDNSGYSIHADLNTDPLLVPSGNVYFPRMTANMAAYYTDDCFDYRTMFKE